MLSNRPHLIGILLETILEFSGGHSVLNYCCRLRNFLCRTFSEGDAAWPESQLLASVDRLQILGDDRGEMED